MWALLCFQFAARLKLFLNVEHSENAGMCFSPHFLLGFEIQAFGTFTLSNTFVNYLPSKGWFDVREIQRAFSVKPYFLEIRKVTFPIVTRRGSRRTVLLRENYDSRYLWQQRREKRTRILEGLSLARIFDFKSILFWQTQSCSVNFSISEKYIIPS